MNNDSAPAEIEKYFSFGGILIDGDIQLVMILTVATVRIITRKNPSPNLRPLKIKGVAKKTSTQKVTQIPTEITRKRFVRSQEASGGVI